MISVEEKEAVRRAYGVDGKSLRQIEREQHHGRGAIKKALSRANAERYHLSQPRESPVLGPYKGQIDALLAQNQKLPRKQRYTAHKIYEAIYGSGYRGCESGVQVYVWRKRSEAKRPEVFVPLEYEPGRDAQADWGEAEVELDGARITAQFLVVRLCYSRKIFVRAYPHQRQEAFLEGQVEAFKFFGGVPHTIWYDNLTTAVQRVLHGRVRQEQRRFVTFRSHYLFETHFCTPGEGHEKGGVENGIGYVRRNLFVPLLKAKNWDDLNAQVLVLCQQDGGRTVHGQAMSIAEAFARQQPALRALPAHPFECGVIHEVTLNGYGQVVFETNRYSVPVERVRKHLVLRASPFRVQILDGEHIIATHVRCYLRQQDIFDPLHYLPLLEQRPGAFAHAKPMRVLRASWPPVYERALARLQTYADEWHDTQGIREFVRILKLQQEFAPADVEAALEQALACSRGGTGGSKINADVVRLYIRQRQSPTPDLVATPLNLDQYLPAPQANRLGAVGQQLIRLSLYDQLLSANPVNATLAAVAVATVALPATDGAISAVSADGHGGQDVG